jgi:ATP-dependent Lon protease
MYAHDHNNQFRHYLKQKALDDEYDFGYEAIDFDQLPEVVRIFNTRKMHAMLQEHERKSNLYRNHQRYLDFLGETEGFLELALLPESIVDGLAALGEQFPNFSEVIDFYRHQFALARLAGRGAFAANPLLIAGPPGIGKTAFCQALARMVDTHFELVSFSGMTAGFVLGGMSSGWADGKPGRVVEALARGLRANPLIVMDEMDKVGGDKRYDPLGALYQLLEKETAAQFVDEGLEIATDCSKIVWVGTANDLDLIAEPIRSRFTILDVKRPTPTQMEAVLSSIYRDIRRGHDWGEAFSEALSSVVIRKIIRSGLEPRMIKQELITACGKAVLRNAREQCPENGLYAVSPEDFNPSQSVTRTRSLVMPVFAVAPVHEEPEETISRWSVREAQFDAPHDQSRHLVGYVARKGKGRVTSAIQSFDRDTMRIQTRSGRVYQLAGPPGFDPDAEYVWAHWKALNQVRDETDVTPEYQRLMH